MEVLQEELPEQGCEPEPPPPAPRLAPQDAFEEPAAGLSPQAVARWLWIFLILGFTLRVTRYLLRFPIWEDEAMLSANFLDRGYLDLLRPLHYLQVAPTLFLWAQLTVIKLLGFTEYTLRLIPFLCGLGSLVLFRHVAGRLLRGTSLVLAVALFAVSYPMLRYAAEAKPYGCDLFLSLVMLALVVEWLRRPGQNRWLWALAALVAPAVGFSFPAIFVAGGMSLVVAYVLWRDRRSGWWPWLVFNLILLAAFASVFIVSRSAVSEVTQRSMEVGWNDTFPPLSQPLELPKWFFEIHCGGMLGYPVGGPHWGSTASFLLAAAGAALLLRRRQSFLLGLLLAPLALNFVAAALHRLPYGGLMRMALYLGASFCILIGLGAAAAVRLAARRRPAASFNWPLASVLGLLLLLGAASLLRDLTQPYKSDTVLRARDFARWFWFSMAQGGEIACFETDFKQSLSPDKFGCGWSSLYYCNQRIYSARHRRGLPPQMDRVSADWPLRCIVYRSPSEEHESPAPDPDTLRHWLRGMQSQYRLVAHDTYPCPAHDRADPRHTSKDNDFIEVFKFLPKDASAR
jgi:hypothetical protein